MTRNKSLSYNVCSVIAISFLAVACSNGSNDAGNANSLSDPGNKPVETLPVAPAAPGAGKPGPGGKGNGGSQSKAIENGSVKELENGTPSNGQIISPSGEVKSEAPKRADGKPTYADIVKQGIEKARVAQLTNAVSAPVVVAAPVTTLAVYGSAKAAPAPVAQAEQKLPDPWVLLRNSNRAFPAPKTQVQISAQAAELAQEALEIAQEESVVTNKKFFKAASGSWNFIGVSCSNDAKIVPQKQFMVVMNIAKNGSSAEAKLKKSSDCTAIFPLQYTPSSETELTLEGNELVYSSEECKDAINSRPTVNSFNLIKEIFPVAELGLGIPSSEQRSYEVDKDSLTLTKRHAEACFGGDMIIEFARH